MDSRKIAIIKIFLASTSLVAYGDFFPMLRTDSSATTVIAGPILWLQLFVSLAYFTVPILALIANNYVSYTLLTGLFLPKSIIEFAGLLPSMFGLHMLMASLYIFAAFFSLILAVESLSSKVRGEIFKLNWSQF